MKPFNVFIQNYKTATEGFNVIVKIIIAMVLSFIFIAIVFAILGVIPEFAQ